MPKGRIIAKKISYDERIKGLSLEATLLYTWCIPHLDIEGRMYAEASIVKGTIVPFIRELTEERIKECLKEMNDKGLILLYGKEMPYAEFNGFFKNQRLDRTKEAASTIPGPDQFGVKSRVTPEQLQSNSATSKVNTSISLSILSTSKEIIHDFNTVYDSNYKIPPTAEIGKLIANRLKEGFKLEDFKKVHRNMKAEWSNDEKMCSYLRPQTLYTGKFESYLNRREKKKFIWEK